MLFKPKELYKYKVLEKIKVDIAGPECVQVAKDNNFIFYRYKSYSDGSGGYILRQDIHNPKKVVFFGENKKFNIAYKDHFFQVDGWGELGRLYITARNILTGIQTKYDWLSQDGIYYVINGFGRFRNQDEVKDVYISDGKLIFLVSREKSHDPHHEPKGPKKYDVTTEYKIVVEEKEGKFHATALFDPHKLSEAKDREKSVPVQNVKKEEKKPLLQDRKKEEKAGASEKYWVTEKGIVRCLDEKCPESCNMECPIYIQTLALERLVKSDFEEAARLLKKAVEIEPDFADAWNNLGAAYGQMEKHREAYNAYQKSYALIQKPNPMYGMAVASKNLKDYQLATQYATIYISKFGSDKRIESLKASISEEQLADKIRE